MNKRTKWIILGVLAILLLVIILVVLIFISFLRGRSLNSRPLVLIQYPVDQALVEVGNGLLVHASARAQQGVTRMELWVDNQLVSTQESQAGVLIPTLVLAESWTPHQEGFHTIIVRAFSRDRVSGQSSIQVQARDAGGTGLIAHVMEEGESVASIANDYDTTPEEVAALNGSGGGGFNPQPGDELIVPAPGGEDPSFMDDMGGEAGETDTPGSGAPAPGSMESLGFTFPAFPFQGSSEPVQLTVEVLTLETPAAYESLHCYVSLGGNSHRWLPDVDDNQSTDESFTSSNFGHTWGIASQLAGDQAVNIFWDENQPIPLDINCVGIAGSGTDAIQLGRVIEAAGPETWGILQHAESQGGEGTFTISYLIDYPTKGLDESITPPWNVRLDERHHLLLWDYSPNIGSQPVVDGFAIIMNDTLQWLEPGSARQARLPDQWFILPCGDEYSFEVVAFNNGYPDGNYSLPSNTASIEGGEVGSPECSRTIVLTFEQLTTGDLPGNPDPVYGSVFVNDQDISFDGRPVEGDNFLNSFGLDKNSVYSISGFTTFWGGPEPQFVVEIPAGNPYVHEYPLWVGFEIYKGGNKICAGENSIGEDDLAGAYEGTIETHHPVGYYPDWCIVSFSLSPVGETPVVDPGSPPPLPDLKIESLTENSENGPLEITIRNVGMAAWTEQDIVARVTTPDGAEIGTFSWTNMTIQPGQVNILMHGGLDYDPSQGVCVELDPDNVVYEERDRLADANIIGRGGRYCRPLPDLSITDASWDPRTSQLNITLQNRGEEFMGSSIPQGTLDNGDVVFWVNTPEGRPLSTVFRDVNMDVRDTIVLNWPLGEAERSRMSGGYNLVVNPEQTIAELDTGNNEFQVLGSARLRITWMVGSATFCPTNTVLLMGENVAYRNHWSMKLDALVGSGSDLHGVASWRSPEFEVPWDESGGLWCSADAPFISDWFDVAGDEALIIDLSANLDVFGHQAMWFSGGNQALTAADDFGGTTHVPVDVDEGCFEMATRYYYDCGPGHATGGCGYTTCGELGQTGQHLAGLLWVDGEDITGDCWWSTTYTIFRQDGEVSP